MKNIRKILFIVTLFLLTGCNVDYTIDINSNKEINEIISLDYSGVKLNSNDINNIVDSYKTSDLYKKYYVTNPKDTIYKGNYIYKSFDELKANSDYAKDLEYELSGNTLTIKFTGDLSNYFLPDEDAAVSLINKVNLNIRAPFKVIESNGKKERNSFYSWEFNNNEYIKNIYIKYELTSNNNKYIMAILVIILLIVIIGVTNVIKKSKEVNRI